MAKKSITRNWLNQYENAGPVVKTTIPPDVLFDPKKFAQWMKDHPENRATAPSTYNIPRPKPQAPKPIIVHVDPRLISNVKPPVTPVIRQASPKPYQPSVEERVDNFLGNPQLKAREIAQNENPNEDPYDNVRHSFAGRYTAEALTNAMDNGLGKSVLSRNPIVQGVTASAGAAGAAMLGLGHEASTYFGDPRWNEDHDRYGNPMPWYKRAYTITREGLEDEFNNAVGATIGASPFVSDKEKDARLWNMIDNNYLPDGYGENNLFRPDGKGAYRDLEQHKNGGRVKNHKDMLNEMINFGKQKQKYRNGGYC